MTMIALNKVKSVIDSVLLDIQTVYEYTSILYIYE